MKKFVAILLTVITLMSVFGVAGAAFFARPLSPGARPTPPAPTSSSAEINATAPSFERQNAQTDTTVRIGGREFTATRVERYTVRERDLQGNWRDVQRTRTVWVNRNIRLNAHNANTRHNLANRFVSLTASVGRVDGSPRMASSIEFWGDGRLLERVDVPLDGTRSVNVDLQGVRTLEIRLTRAAGATQQPSAALINPTVTTVTGVTAAAQREYEQSVANWERAVQRRAAWDNLSSSERMWQQIFSGTATFSAIGAAAFFGLAYFDATGLSQTTLVILGIVSTFIFLISGALRLMGRV